MRNAVRVDKFVTRWQRAWIQLNLSQNMDQVSQWMQSGLCVGVIYEGVKIVPDEHLFNQSTTGYLDFKYYIEWISTLYKISFYFKYFFPAH